MYVAGDGMRTRPWPMLSSLGVGTYLGSEDDDTDEQVRRTPHFLHGVLTMRTSLRWQVSIVQLPIITSANHAKE